jgi:hypothetical protein
MRSIVVAAILLLGISSAVPEPEHGSVPAVQTIAPAPIPATMPDLSASSGQAAPGSTPIPTAAQAASAPTESVDDVCSTLLTSAQANDLPVAFFANLIWQESRLHDNALSPKGAMGIAQFMPKVAAASGVANPFDPAQALPASAKLLDQLFGQFGNLGYVAAAYNAGAHRVSDWLEHGRALPRETRDYVMHITGRSLEAWRKKPQDDAGLRFTPQLPCRRLSTFAALEQTQSQQAELEQKKGEQAYAEVTPSQQQTPSQKTPAGRTQEVAKATATAQHEKRAGTAKDVHQAEPIGHADLRVAKNEPPRIERMASAHIRHGRSEAHRRA